MPSSVPEPRVLCAVLASPPQTSGVRTRNALDRAAGILNCDHVVVVNLLDVPTSDTGAMSTVGRDPRPWLESRVALAGGLNEGQVLLAAWGVSELTGPAREHRRDQVRWVVQAALDAGHDLSWTVGHRPRHPSRWHQFVADRHRRTDPGLTFEERLRQVLLRRGTQLLLDN